MAPVPEDWESWAKNRQKNEEQKLLAEEAKAKKAREVEDLAKCRREAKKVGLPEPESPKASISKGGF